MKNRYFVISTIFLVLAFFFSCSLKEPLAPINESWVIVQNKKPQFGKPEIFIKFAEEISSKNAVYYYNPGADYGESANYKPFSGSPKFGQDEWHLCITKYYNFGANSGTTREVIGQLAGGLGVKCWINKTFDEVTSVDTPGSTDWTEDKIWNVWIMHEQYVTCNNLLNYNTIPTNESYPHEPYDNCYIFSEPYNDANYLYWPASGYVYVVSDGRGDNIVKFQCEIPVEDFEMPPLPMFKFKFQMADENGSFE